jgi:hypothetical protein
MHTYFFNPAETNSGLSEQRRPLITTTLNTQHPEKQNTPPPWSPHWIPAAPILHVNTIAVHRVMMHDNRNMTMQFFKRN